MTELQYSPAKKWQPMPFEQAVEIFDTYRSPINSDCRNKRVNGKPQSDLYPYYGATGQVGWIDGYLLDGEYVLLGEDGAPFLDSLASKAYLVHGKVWVNNHAHILKSKYNNKFLLYYLNQIDYKPLVTGTTRLKLTQAAMKNIAIPTPSLPEQERIVARIEELFSELDKGVEALQTIKAQLKVYRQAVLKEAFEGSLTGSHPQAKQELGDFIEVPRYGTAKKCSFDNVENSTPVYRIPNIHPVLGVISHSDIKSACFSESELAPIRLRIGDILIIRSNGSPSLVGRAAIIRESDTDAVFAGYLLRLRISKLEKLDSLYLLNYLASHEARIYIERTARSTSGVNNISAGEICQLKVPIFSLQEQKLIVTEIESRLSVCDKIEQTVDESLAKAESLRQSILKKAFEGRL